jgi:hypothetical protein
MRVTRAFVARLTGVICALGLTGCSYAIERDWESLDTLGNGQLNRLSAYTDKTADATVYATRASDPNSWTKFYFEGTWAESNDYFVFDFACKAGPCDADDFRMTCQIIDENNDQTFKLDCEADRNWKSYPFSWQEVL